MSGWDVFDPRYVYICIHIYIYDMYVCIYIYIYISSMYFIHWTKHHSITLMFITKFPGHHLLPAPWSCSHHHAVSIFRSWRGAGNGGDSQRNRWRFGGDEIYVCIFSYIYIYDITLMDIYIYLWWIEYILYDITILYIIWFIWPIYGEFNLNSLLPELSSFLFASNSGNRVGWVFDLNNVQFKSFKNHDLPT